MDKQEILQDFELFSLQSSGIGSWLGPDTHSEVFTRLASIDQDPLSKVQLNQLLAFGHEAPVSDDFFRYYWLTAPQNHPYDVTRVPGFDEGWLGSSAITSLAHLKWGLYRLFTDGLLWLGNVRTAYRQLRPMTNEELCDFFDRRQCKTEIIQGRGPALPLAHISKDDRFLISEMACNSYGERPDSPSKLKTALLDAWRTFDGSRSQITVRRLLEGESKGEFIFSVDDVLDETVDSEYDIEAKYEAAAMKYFKARESALKNTRMYLSMVGDLDVYVATSMRTRQDFRDMADVCESIFSDQSLKDLQLRYFDPTLSAAEGDEDKSLIECLMVKCSKVLVYCAREGGSWGKDAEAAMALSLGKPVIVYCTSEQKARFYREVHPLSRLVEFETGVAVGAIVTDDLKQVSELLLRIFGNRMEYEIDQPKPGYLRLKEKMTGSVVRMQTNDLMLSETFWNYYHNRNSGSDRY